MEKRIGVDDDKQDRREKEERDERQIDIEKWQLDRIFKQQIAVRDAACRDADIEQRKKIAEPEAAADRRRIFNALAGGFKSGGVFCRRIDFACTRRALGGRRLGEIVVGL